MSLTVLSRGGQAIVKALEDEHKTVIRRGDKAAQAGARVFAKQIRKALPRKKGTLRRHVKVYRVGEGAYKAKVVGHVAHLVLADVAAHEIAPRAMKALGINGSARARAMVPAHRGRPELIATAREAASAEAALAAKEVLAHG